MNIDMEHVFPASREALWTLLHDPARMTSWIPGCEKLEATGPDRYAATLKVGVASIKGTYTGSVQISDKEYPSRYTLTVEGKAAPGFVQGTAAMELAEEDAQHTRLTIKAKAQVGGLIASVGQRFLTGVARQLTRELLRNIEKAVQADGPASHGAEGTSG